MVKMGSSAAWYIALAILTCASCIFVDPVGRDFDGCGSSDQPCATLERALQSVTGPETITVRPGTYSGDGSAAIDFGGAHDLLIQIDEDSEGVVVFDCLGESGFLLGSGERNITFVC